MEWNEEVIVRLRDLWAEGHSTAEIGRRLGVSKNAIVGKAHRLDLPARPSPIKREGTSTDAPRRSAPRRIEGPTLPPLASADMPPVAPVVALAVEAPVPPPVVQVEVAPPPPPPPIVVSAPPPPPQPSRPTIVPPPRAQAGAPRSFGRVVTCCWPIGEPGTRSFRFCDDPSDPGKPYCAEHAKLAYVKVRDRREDAA